MERLMLTLQLLLTLSVRVFAAAPFALTWSSKTYGPDGPWNAVSVTIGTPGQSVDLYAGGRWSSTILLSSLCSDSSVSTTCAAKNAGLFDPSKSNSTGNITDPKWKDIDYFPVPGYGRAHLFYDTVGLGSNVSVPNVTMTGVFQANQTYPDGTAYPVEVGWLSLGAPQLQHVFTETMNFVPSYLYTTEETPSYSYGMHIGSAPQDIPGSLILGGYDPTRVLGDISAQPFTPYTSKNPGGKLVIDLQDISLGVATGGSPWEDFKSKAGLLAQANPVTVDVDPTKPYLYLPKRTCDAITVHLPVTYQPKYGLYFWNTSDPLYKDVTTSAAYLTFTFLRDSSSTATLPVKVPFALLTLTLESPLIAHPTPYFPCMVTNSSSTYTLGRAFLQAAFIGVNYGTGSGKGNWFLAQAPGPTLPSSTTDPSSSSSSSLTPIKPTDETLSSSTTNTTWRDTWSAHWTPLPHRWVDTGMPGVPAIPDTPDSSSGGLSPGAIAGIAVGFGLAGLLLLLEVSWLLILRRRRRAERGGGRGGGLTGEEYGGRLGLKDEFFYAHLRPRSHQTPVMLSDDMELIRQGKWNRAELAGNRRVEMGDDARSERWELD